MLDPKIIRGNPDQIRKAIRVKNVKPTMVDKWLALDKRRAEIFVESETLRGERNKLAEKFKKKRPTEGEKVKAREVRRQIQNSEKELVKIEKKWKQVLEAIPNLPAKDVPIGKDEDGNVEVRRWGEPTKFDFEPKNHAEIGEKLSLIDVASASIVSGSRFGYLIGEAVLLEFALVQFALETLIKEGFTPVVPPVMIKKDKERDLGYMEHGGEDDMYILEKDNLVLVATAEHSLVARYCGEALDVGKPKRYVGFSTCFRREAGTYGKDTKGILRVHQFDKVEMVSFIKPEGSEKEHEYLVSLQEKLMQALKLPYRIMKMCTGDLAQPQAKRFDLETWLPGENRYRETHSCSNCTDYQARRLNIKQKEASEGKYVHILNGTAYAIGRTIIAILENYQQKDGSVVVPKVLRKWVGKDKIVVNG